MIRPSTPAAAVTWASVEWQPTTFEDPPNQSDQDWDQAVAVTSGPNGYVAVGSNWNVMRYVGRIWQSLDSLNWRLVQNDLLSGLTASVLTSRDGLTWERTETIRDAWASRVAGGPNGFAVVLQVRETTEILFSSDATTWTRFATSDMAPGTWVADIASVGEGWVAAGRNGNRAVVFRTADESTWAEDTLPGSEPISGIAGVSARRLLPGRWATLLLGTDMGAPCQNEGYDDEFCTKYGAAWSWTNATGWQRLPKSSWIVAHGAGGAVEAAGDAGFAYAFANDTRLSPDGWEWTSILSTSASNAFPADTVITGDRLVAVGIPVGVPDDSGELVAWFGSAQITR